eukprot:scaffold304990_cov21-Tisochrysis_lutea.AAC.1
MMDWATQEIEMHKQCLHSSFELRLRVRQTCFPEGVLSGGEKARVALAAFSLVPCNVLLLDEASNHLDAATISVLTVVLSCCTRREAGLQQLLSKQSCLQCCSVTQISVLSVGEVRAQALPATRKCSFCAKQ